MTKVLLPTAIPLDPELPDGVVAVPYDPAEPVPIEHRDAEGVVIWGNPRPRLREMATDLPRLRWVQSLAAGPDAALSAGFADDVVLCGGAGLHDAPVTEHALALVLALVRRLPAAAQAQHEHRWARELGGRQPLHPGRPVTTLIGARVVLWGFGSIAQRLAGVLTSLGAEVRGVARSAGTRAGYPVADVDDVENVLAGVDILVLLLPGLPENEKILDARLLCALPAGAYVVNVGRGSTVDEDALRESLACGWLAGAALDVTATEPLPADSPLWDAPNVVITPHAAGGRPVGADELVAANLRALVDGGPVRNVIDR
ncbi:phosphoglycerate dehydrogenase [Georgenia sp. M64]|uniref:phosphoglycerate dehydrogenase n=1 Tax=Georgenia sp. M64 TaxID=3120520 RepID=UPI0030E1EDC7